MAERNLVWDVFDYTFEAGQRRIGRIKPIRTYRNPFFLAWEWKEAMEEGNFRSQRHFAKAIGLSHARVSQVLGMLRLCMETQKDLENLGDPLYARQITERKLRPLVNLPKKGRKLKRNELLR